MISPNSNTTVVPEPGLGVCFETAPRRALGFSARAIVAGLAPAAASQWEPEDPQLPELDFVGMRFSVLRRDGQCVYCGWRTSTLELDTVTDNHCDLAPDSQVASDPLCHGYHHLADLGEGNGRIAYLPELDTGDVNHLQRMLMIELYEGDEEGQSDAKDLLNWLGSHSSYTAEAFGTDRPDVFAAVLNRVDPQVRQRRDAAFDGLALIYHPRLMHRFVSVWNGEVTTGLPRTCWHAFYQDAMRLTA